MRGGPGNQNRLSQDPEEAVVFAVLGVGGAFCCFVGGTIIMVGGSKLRSLRSFGWAMAGTITTFVVGLLICMPLIAVGIWPLIVLLDAEVREGFGHTADRTAA